MSKQRFICKTEGISKCIYCFRLQFTSKTSKNYRGWVTWHESWNKKDFAGILGKEIEFVQDNESTSKIGVLRGLHYQLKQQPQSKLVRVTQGRIYDVVVDFRESSDTFLKWAGVYLDDKLNEQLWIPSGFAHGFLTLSNFAKLNYKVTGYWSSVLEKTLLWNDSNINIESNKKVRINRAEIQ